MNALAPPPDIDGAGGVMRWAAENSDVLGPASSLLAVLVAVTIAVVTARRTGHALVRERRIAVELQVLRDMLTLDFTKQVPAAAQIHYALMLIRDRDDFRVVRIAMGDDMSDAAQREFTDRYPRVPPISTMPTGRIDVDVTRLEAVFQDGTYSREWDAAVARRIDERPGWLRRAWSRVFSAVPRVRPRSSTSVSAG